MDRYQLAWQQCFDAPAPDQAIAWVVDIGRPAQWEAAARIWRGVQTEWGWPAPAIAVNGLDGYQLWMRLAQPMPVSTAQAMLEALCQSLVPDVPPARLRSLPVTGAGEDRSVPTVPRLDATRDVWSAFVAPDLAPVFEDTPWLDLPPNQDGQAELLARLKPLTAEHLAALAPRAAAHAPSRQPSSVVAELGGMATPLEPDSAQLAARHAQVAARSFLLSVMQDEAQAMALRIEAARALLGGTKG